MTSMKLAGMELLATTLSELQSIEQAKIHEFISYGMVVLSLITFIACMVKTAPYGRHTSTASKWWGPKINAVAAWVIMECPSPLIAAYFWFYGNRTTASLLLFLIFETHYFNRTFVYPFRMINPTPMFVSIMMQGFFFNLVNGFLQGYIIGQLATNEMLNLQFGVGTVMFVLGWIINNQSDAILISLKKKNKGYLIPQGGAFEYVSAANYFGELIEWLGWFVLTDTLAAFAFFIFTFSNLAPRAHAHHKWFKEKFGDKYPKSRKAIIPFIW